MIKKRAAAGDWSSRHWLAGRFFFFFLSEMICFLRGCTTDGTPHPRLWGWSRPWIHDLGRQGALNSNGLGLGSAQLRPPHFLRPGQSLLSPRRQQTQLGGRTQFLTGSSASIVCCRPLGVGRLRESQGPGVWRCSISALTFPPWLPAGLGEPWGSQGISMHW